MPEQKQPPAQPLNVRLKLKFQTVEQFLAYFGEQLQRQEISLPTRHAHPPGTPLKLEITLVTGQPVLCSQAVVLACQSSGDSPLISAKLSRLDPRTPRQVIDFIESRKAPSRQPAAEPGAQPQADVSLDDAGQPAPRPAASHRGPPPVIGIDLGTTNSCAAVVINGRPQIIPTRKGYRTIPSMVAYNREGRLLVGHEAKAQAEINPHHTVYGSKRLIGRPYTSPAVQQMKDRFHYQIIPGPRNEAAVRIVGRDFSLQQIAAFILAEIRDIAREFLGCEVNEAVITVPAYYNENQRQAVREAGLLAGLQVKRILNEPTAAALAFGYNRGLDQRLLVYDLGGGTFDVSVLELTGNVYEVIATGGDTFLGGVDFDNQIVDYVLYEFCNHLGRVPKLDRSAMQRLRDAAELAKCALSEKQETIIRLPFFVAVDNTPKDLEVRLSRQQLEQLCGPLVERTIQVCHEVLNKAHMSPTKIDQILLVGGQTRMPLVWRRIQEEFGREPSKGVHPDEAVAIGAALLAASQDAIDSVVLIDVLPMSIGLGAPGGRFFPLLQAGTALPANRAYTIRTAFDDQQHMEFFVFQGESERVVNNEYLGTLSIDGITPAPKGEVSLEITLSVNQEGLLKITSRELPSGRLLECRLASRDTADTIREKLRIPPEEQATERIGQKETLGEKGVAESGHTDAEEKPAGGGLLGRLLGRRKS